MALRAAWRGQVAQDVFHAPGAREVQAVQVRDLGIGRVRDVGRLHDLFDFRHARQIPIEPGRELLRREDLAHQQGFGQCAGDVFVTAGFVVGG
jgi:hypothetical protein